MPDEPNLPEPPTKEEIEARLGGLREKLNKAKTKVDSRSSNDLDPETSRGMGLGLAAAYAIIGLPFVGALLGWLVDRSLGTPNIFIMVGVILGGILGIAHAVRLSNRQR
jgi:F0F1-type ATP synthase assembly protein I